MAFYSNSIQVFPGAYPSPPDAATGSLLYSDGGSNSMWAYPGSTNFTASATFKVRTILTHGFICNGYRGSVTWRNVQKTYHGTDTTFSIGEQVDRAGSNMAALFSDYNGYICGNPRDSSVTGSSVHTSSINLLTGASRTRGYGNFGSGTAPSFGYIGDNPVSQGVNYGDGYAAEGTARTGLGGMDMSVARRNHVGMNDLIGGKGYLTGGGSAVTEKLHYATESMYTAANNSGGTGTASGIDSELASYIYITSAGFYKFTYSTDTYTSITSPGGNGTRRGLSSKWGWGYLPTGVAYSAGWSQFNTTTGASITTFNFPYNTSEETLQMGQNKGYMLGANYSGTSSNLTYKFDYSSNALTAMGTATQPKTYYGHAGAVSLSAAAQVAALVYSAV